MSKCAVHMMKLKGSALGGIQSHNQREHESRKNKDIDYERSIHNRDLINPQDINYQQAVKQRIEQLDLKKAVRKDAVVLCNFIISSDSDFFKGLGEKYYLDQCNEQETYAMGLQEPTEFEYLDESVQQEYIREGSREFFDRATEFFKERYGEENVLNATIHYDEATPHMHLGLIPVKDGRLSAKSLFTPIELKQLQTDFAKEVGDTFGLERGQEGSKATHLNELDYKLKVRGEQLERLEQERTKLSLECSDSFKTLQNTKEELESLTNHKSTLKTQIESLENRCENLKSDIQALDTIKQNQLDSMSSSMTLEEKLAQMERQKSLDRIQMEKDKRLALLEIFVQIPAVKKSFEKFIEKMQEHIRNKKMDKDKGMDR